ncbi:MAG: endonuclease/exonuclease/phosphatase family protein [Bdellovibrionales bacterium]
MFFALALALFLPFVEADSLTVANLNVWAVPAPGVSKKIRERFDLIPDAIAATHADVIFLQEAWRDSSKHYLAAGLRRVGYPYIVFGEASSVWSERLGLRGLFGNGLMIASKYPLSPVKVMKFSNYTRADEYPTFKGALYTRIHKPGFEPIDLFTAHLGAFTTETIERDGKQIPDHINPRHTTVKLSQAYELINFIKAERKSRSLIFAGDLNTHYFEFLNGKYDVSKVTGVYSAFTCLDRADNLCLGLTDSFVALNGLYGRNSNVTRPFTYDTETNTYAKGGEFATEPPGAIDYIYVNRNGQLKPVSSQVIFNEMGSPGEPDFLSDHYGLLSVFEVIR